jgi:hypothetical protein
VSTLVSEHCVTVAVPSPVEVSRPSWSDVLALARGLGPYLWCGPEQVAAALSSCGVSPSATGGVAIRTIGR